jgi:hypothetical protein
MSGSDLDPERIVETAVNVATNVVTGGVVGYSNGSFGRGAVTHGVDEVIGELTGRNQARKALFEQKDAARAAIDEKRRLRMEEIRRRGLQQKNLSQNVQATRQVSEAGGSAAIGGADTGGGGPLNEFLGLG